MARPLNRRGDLQAVREGVGTRLRTLLSDLLHEPLPDHMADSLKQLDQPSEKLSER
jgi:hypothetical protein